MAAKLPPTGPRPLVPKPPPTASPARHAATAQVHKEVRAQALNAILKPRPPMPLARDENKTRTAQLLRHLNSITTPEKLEEEETSFRSVVVSECTRERGRLEMYRLTQKEFLYQRVQVCLEEEHSRSGIVACEDDAWLTGFSMWALEQSEAAVRRTLTQYPPQALMDAYTAVVARRMSADELPSRQRIVLCEQLVFSETLERLIYDLQLRRQWMEHCTTLRPQWLATHDTAAEQRASRRALEDAELVERDTVESALLMEYLAVAQRVMTERRHRVWTDVEGREYRSRQAHERAEQSELDDILVLVDRAFGSFGWLRRAAELMREEATRRDDVVQEEFSAFRLLRIAALREWHNVYSVATREIETTAAFLHHETSTRKDIMAEEAEARDASGMDFRLYRRFVADRDQARANTEGNETTARGAVIRNEVVAFGEIRTEFFVSQCDTSNLLDRQALVQSEVDDRLDIINNAAATSQQCFNEFALERLLIAYCRMLTDVEREEAVAFGDIVLLFHSGHKATQDVEYVLAFFARQEDSNRAALISHEFISRGNMQRRFATEWEAIEANPRPVVATAPETIHSLGGVEEGEVVARHAVRAEAAVWWGAPDTVSAIADHLEAIYAATVRRDLWLRWVGICAVELSKLEWIETKLRRRVAMEGRLVLQRCRAMAVEGKEPMRRAQIAAWEMESRELLALEEMDARPGASSASTELVGQRRAPLSTMYIAGQTVLRPVAASPRKQQPDDDLLV